MPPFAVCCQRIHSLEKLLARAVLNRYVSFRPEAVVPPAKARSNGCQSIRSSFGSIFMACLRHSNFFWKGAFP